MKKSTNPSMLPDGPRVTVYNYGGLVWSPHCTATSGISCYKNRKIDMLLKIFISQRKVKLSENIKHLIGTTERTI